MWYVCFQLPSGVWFTAYTSYPSRSVVMNLRHPCSYPHIYTTSLFPLTRVWAAAHWWVCPWLPSVVSWAHTSHPSWSLFIHLSPRHSQLLGSILILRVVAHLASGGGSLWGLEIQQGSIFCSSWLNSLTVKLPLGDFPLLHGEQVHGASSPASACSTT
jgi:hypothetical protein